MIPVAVQLYSVRDAASEDFMATLDRVAEYGYAGVEFAGYHGFSAADLRRKLDSLGLKAAGTHTAIAEFDDEKFNRTVDLHKELGCEFAIIPWLSEELRNTPQACLETAKKLSDIAHKVDAAGLRTGFHAHDGDMKPLDGGDSAWYLIAKNTPDSFLMQYDTANGMSGGADAAQPILDFPGRSVSVHLKEHNGIGVGTGDVPWDKVFAACEGVGGTQWYVVEDEATGGLDAFEAVRISIENLRKMGKA